MPPFCSALPGKFRANRKAHKAPAFNYSEKFVSQKFYANDKAGDHDYGYFFKEFEYSGNFTVPLISG